MRQIVLVYFSIQILKRGFFFLEDAYLDLWDAEDAKHLLLVTLMIIS